MNKDIKLIWMGLVVGCLIYIVLTLNEILHFLRSVIVCVE